MTLLSCCGFRRTASPDSPPIRLAETSQPKARFALSSHSLTPVEGPRQAKSSSDILSLSSEEVGPHLTSSGTSGHELLPLHETEGGIQRTHSSRRIKGGAGKAQKRVSCDSDMSERISGQGSSISGQNRLDLTDVEAGIHRRLSSRTLHGAGGRIRQRLSRDSGMSKRSSRRLLRNESSLENMDRRAELKRALHQRVKDSLQDGGTMDDQNYDDDAVPLKTPDGTLARHEGTIQISPRYLKEVLRRSNSPSCSLHREHPQRESSEAQITNNATAALSRMLTRRASQMTRESENQIISTPDGTPKQSQSRKKYIFDEDTPRALPKPQSRSSLDRSSTVLRSTSASKLNEPGLMNPPLLHTLGKYPSQELQPPSYDDPQVNGKSDPYLPKRVKLPTNLDRVSRPIASYNISAGVYDTRIRPASESWLHGASGLLGPSPHAKSRSEDSSSPWRDHPDKKASKSHSCDPKHEELGFGGIDGKADSPPISIYHAAKTRVHSDGTDPVAFAHIYNMHVPARLVSQPLLTSISFPQLFEPRRKRSFSSGGSGAFQAQSRRQTSSSETVSPSITALSSELPSPGNPMAWDNPYWRAASSVYSSRPSQQASLLSSQQSSLHHVTTLQERLHCMKGSSPNEDIISVQASPGKSIDLEKLERQSEDTNYHSSNESLMQQGLAAAETRIIPLPRAKTLPTKSRFKEELEQISAEIALTNPFRRRVSNLDGNGEWSRASQALNDYQATSIWEKALREHSQEDAALEHTRLGSDSRGPLDLETDRNSRKGSKGPGFGGAREHLSVEDWHGSRLQARLAAYKMSTSAKNLEGKRPVKAIRPSASASEASSWTRYPSHTHSERALSPASESDQVYTRDFANMTPGISPERQRSAKIKGNGSLSKGIVSSLKHIYRTQSQELQRRLTNEARGHRSSVSEGGVLEYPELEMLGTISPPIPSPEGDVEAEMVEAFKNANQHGITNQGSQGIRDPSGEGAKGWSKLYADCIEYPAGSEISPSAAKLKRAVTEAVGPTEMEARKGGERSGSSELRKSTLDFKRSLELGEEMARQRVLGLAVGLGG